MFSPKPYSLILSNITQNEFAETKFAYQYLTERHLQALWLEQKYFKDLRTADGERISVISPGIWNAEAGPDFLKAHLIIGSTEIKGDIELHLVQEGWTQHRHNEDRRYNNVVLHVCLFNPKQIKNIQTSTGTSIEQAFLESFLTIPHARILQLIDLDLYPYRKFIGSGACAQSLFKNLNEEKVINFFKSSSAWRLKQKYIHLQSKVTDSALMLGAGIAMGLGYKHNIEPFFELFIHLQKHCDRTEDEILAQAMGVCGYFDEEFQKKWSISPKYQQLFNIYSNHYFKLTHQITLTKGKIRPLNHPLRRLVYLSKFLKSLFFNTKQQLLLLWQDFIKEPLSKTKCLSFREQIKLQIPEFTDKYWNYHYNFEKESRDQFLPLMGDDLKDHIIVNTFLPYLYHYVESKGDPVEVNYFEEFYKSFPAAKNSKTEYLKHRFFGETSKGSVLKKAYLQQGAFQLHKDFCLHYEASCEGCPFFENYKSVFKVN